MLINNHIIDESLISDQGFTLQDVGPLLEEKFNIKGFGRIYIHGIEAMIGETSAIIKLCFEDRFKTNSYWLGSKNNTLFPGDIDPAKQILIANLDTDVPICMDFRTKEINPPIIWLRGDGWEQICSSHATFMHILNEFQKK